MDLIIKIIFILSMVVFNLSMLNLLYRVTNDEKQKMLFIILCGFNVLATTTLLAVLHPLMVDQMHLLAFSGFVGGGVVFAASVCIGITIE